MIEIKLTGEEALAYIESKTENQDHTALVNALESATQYIDTLEAQIKAYETPRIVETKPSSRVLRDTATAKAFGSSKQLRGKIQEDTEPKSVAGSWTDGEIQVIEYAMSRPENELNRKFSVVVEKLGRKKSSVRAKLAEMSIKVEQDTLQWK